ncbi:DUF4215 domain-containing protein [Candidatus Peribacteria bacterium]|jgi:cysteine-rich repeat protein|nr:DUF4215 domain-containing protein [Candidatus Peribacteria bacterium]MBT4021269.1 DUF4215 domain-containing protein [Candidatus Peribacteria bacterium]MBT4240666.1 DUF4215 domain-containing protein [Candidatus Peribacteria bacterium]MBT4474011.1 DUF4215 domain-containing protein [Candidatus Peribacteria bacterium]
MLKIKFRSGISSVLATLVVFATLTGIIAITTSQVSEDLNLTADVVSSDYSLEYPYCDTTGDCTMVDGTHVPENANQCCIGGMCESPLCGDGEIQCNEVCEPEYSEFGCQFGDGPVNTGWYCDPTGNSSECNAGGCNTASNICSDWSNGGIFCTSDDDCLGSCEIHTTDTCCSDDCKTDLTGTDSCPICGDGVINGDEECEPDDLSACEEWEYCGGQGCTCTSNPSPCGNGELDPGEQCDGYDMGNWDPDLFRCVECEAIFKIALCGNGTAEQGEECGEDQLPDCNESIGEACSQKCECEMHCGNSELDVGETCEPSTSPPVACNAGEICNSGCVCESDLSCGNGIADPGEECGEQDMGSCPNAGEICVSCKCVIGCGNGNIDPGEECENNDHCSTGEICTDCTCESDGTCPNGFTDPPDEDCDDGNTNTYDSCTNSCKDAKCGDEIVWHDNEDCDYGDFNSDTSNCTSSCQFARCGDGFTHEGNEECDKGDDNNSDNASCTSECENAMCGDGNVWNTDGGTEECDYGQLNNDYGQCTLSCKNPRCGDGFRQVTNNENCDDGDTLNGTPNYCNDTCSGITASECGNGISEEGEDCDEGASNSDTGNCTSSCKFARCGDSLVQAGVETCDDGDLNGDPGFCNTSCNGITDPDCGNGIIEGAEECDEGTSNSDTGSCTTSCMGPRCGDGFVWAGNETCDEGSTLNGTPNHCNDVCDGMTIPVCGNNIAESGEECHDEGLTCPGNQPCDTSTCKCGEDPCGNGNIDPGEECETHDDCTISYHSCTDTCICQFQDANLLCEDGIIQHWENCGEIGLPECEEGEYCGTTCECKDIVPGCGNFIEDFPDEQCDDGGACRGGTAHENYITTLDEAIECITGGGITVGISGDGCSEICQLESDCGNGIVEFSEGCDDGGKCVAGDANKIGNNCTTLTVLTDCGLSGICEPEEGDGCDDVCQIDQCEVIGNVTGVDAYVMSLYNLGKFEEGMYNANVYEYSENPWDLPWFDDDYMTRTNLYAPKDVGANILGQSITGITEIPFVGPVDNLPHDPAYFAAKWEGVLNVPSLGEYDFHFGSRDDAWVVLDGNVIASHTGTHLTVEDQEGSIVLQPGSYNLEIYYSSRSPYQCNVAIEDNCTDTVDNDGDGATDCNDFDCINDTACQITQINENDLPPLLVTTGNDEEGFAASIWNVITKIFGSIFGSDSKLTAELIGITTGNDYACSNRSDDDGDGLIDCADPGCRDDSLSGWQMRTVSSENYNGDDITSADIDSDGDKDIIVANSSDNEIVVYLNDGSSPPWFTANVFPLANNHRPKAIDVGDLNGDNRKDIAIASQYGNSVQILINDGGTGLNFQPARIIDSIAYYAYDIEIADLNDDGKMDLVVPHAKDNVNPSRFAVYRNTTSSVNNVSFSRSILDTIGSNAFFTSAHVDQFRSSDSYPTIFTTLTSEDLIVAYKNSGSSFTRVDIPTSANAPWSVKTADINNDGLKDIVMGSRFDNSIWWYEMGPEGLSSTMSVTEHLIYAGDNISYPYSIDIGDIDADGDIDIVIASSVDGSLNLLYNYSNGSSFSAPNALFEETLSFVDAVHITDFDTDSRKDIISTSKNTVRWHEWFGLNECKPMADSERTECNDGVDNADTEDSFIDADDPGCHIGGNMNNPYDPNILSEDHTIGCGNGKQDHIDETCDDGNQDNTDDCLNSCENAWCGDGYIANGNVHQEYCDDGTLNGTQTNCNSTCTGITPPLCGNGEQDPGEDCEQDNECNSGELCLGCECISDGTCGNGYADLGEECNDPGLSCSTGEICNATNCLCESDGTCGNGYQDPGEECNEPGLSCTDLGETCDNSICECTYEPGCMNGVEDPGEECDDGNNIDEDNCTNSCKDAICGDGVTWNLESGTEECDDGNLILSDGCNNNCDLTTECNDTVDNDGDLLIDSEDPGCHIDDNLTNPYDETDDDESNSEYCTNGLQEGSEECDDGNNVDEDNCTNACEIATCGDGVTWNLESGTEECDDGNIFNSDDCTRACENARCGDDIVWHSGSGTETCDDGDALNGTPLSCNAVCTGTTEPVCPNGVIESGEECDDDNTLNIDACTDVCEDAECGDGYIWVGQEECDDGDTSNTNLCLNSCDRARCGDGFIYAGIETCDEGDLVNGTPNHCNSTCNGTTNSECGNGTQETGEACDDGNLARGDGCDDNCNITTECNDTVDNDLDLLFDANDPGCHTDGDSLNTLSYDSTDNNESHTIECGNGAIEGSETCDNGGANSNTSACTLSCADARCGDYYIWTGNENCDEGDALNGTPNHCNATCTGITGSVCGNGTQESGEACDDGNLVRGDGCDDNCNITTECNDTVNNDSDIFIDAEDPGCHTDGHVLNATSYDPSDNDEFNPISCGNGAIELGEDCDDGNLLNTDACTNNCGVARCGDYYVYIGVETCDDGDLVNGTPNHCNATCTGTTDSECGNGTQESGEECDDGNLVRGDGCDDNCNITYECNDTVDNDSDTFIDIGDPGCHTDENAANDATYRPTWDVEDHTALCRNGVEEPGEDCDDGNDLNTDACTEICENARCGDGHIYIGVETCDDGDALNGTPNHCNLTCDGITSSSCNNRVKESGEECDDGNLVDEDDCTNACEDAECGDGFTWNLESGTETCDDENTTLGDGCDNNCNITTQCSDTVDNDGDLVADTGDPGCHTDENALNGTSYDATDDDETHAASCGNGVEETGEDCDDGNNLDGDGCSADCHDQCATGDIPSAFYFFFDDPELTVSPTPTCPVCGDGITEGREDCEDISECSTGEACTSCECVSDGTCNNGYVDSGEECGETELPVCPTGEGCNLDCVCEDLCGNGVSDAGEQCGEPTLPNCTGSDICGGCRCIDTCGDGIVDSYEECDDGNTNTNDNCTNSCQDAECGDGITWDQGVGSETCDDGNTSDTDGCLNTCQIATCGDSFIREGVEDCEIDTDCPVNQGCTVDACQCIDTCIGNTCDPNEDCTCPDCYGEQDGCDNGYICDASSQSCTEKPCGNGRIDAREYCDPSVPPSDNGSNWECDTDNCTLIYTCGNALEELGEQCDPPTSSGGNQFCRADCTIDACAIVDLHSGNGFIGSYFNMPSWHYGMDDNTVNGPSDPVPDPYLWFSDIYLKRIDETPAQISLPAPFDGPDNSIPGDASHHSAMWRGTVTVQSGGAYQYTLTTRDDAWIVIRDGFTNVIVDAVTGIQDTVSTHTSSIFLTEGTHIMEIYFVSRQGGVGLEGTFFFSFNSAGIAVAPYYPGCPFCGNGLQEPGETCDDGFVNGSGDGVCNSICTGFGSATCGNGVEEPGEECDDGNLNNGDGCSDQCTNEPECGNGVTEGTEQCDDGNLTSGDGCSATCILETECGNQVEEQGEQCDDGKHCLDATGITVNCTNDNSVCVDPLSCDPVDGDGCSSTCQIELILCGNAIENSGEECDDGGLCIGGIQNGIGCTTPLGALNCALNGGNCIAQNEDGDNCDSNCQIEVVQECGNGIRENPPEECDYGTCGTPPTYPCNSDAEPDMCRTTCDLPYCGDGIRDPGNAEQCDTGDARSNSLSNACRLNCMNPSCGDGVTDPINQEECDNGQLNSNTTPDSCRDNCTEPVCGDDVIDTTHGEICDDGNTNDGDGCSANCQEEEPVCPNGNQETGEQCDDGNMINTDTCTDQCELTFCGDGIPQSPNGTGTNEDCDDGNNIDTDSCSNSCQIPIECGNGITEPGEECDDQNLSEDDACNNSCEFTSCGDGIRQILNGEDINEECDDGNNISGDGCSDICETEIPPNCGDGQVQTDEGEECDDENTDNTDTCTNMCQNSECGDGLLWVGTEECDDQNLNLSDQCNNDCELTSCGDGIIQSTNGDGENEECDDGNNTSGDGCSDICEIEPPICGNEILEGDEQCDDGNLTDGDGCSDTCTLEAVCGNNAQEQGEQCDDGNNISGDGCSEICELEPTNCGNGIPEAGEQCDDGNTDETDACNNECIFTLCGDGIIQSTNGIGETEECEDGNNIGTDACTNECMNSVCGDNITQSPNSEGIHEECDDGDTNGSNYCNTSCRKTHCGDGIIQSPNAFGLDENCDDGNQNTNDSCTNLCSIASCGDGIVFANVEQCDDGNNISGDGCSFICITEAGSGTTLTGSTLTGSTLCGNGTKENYEECDDHNINSGDGCSSSCLVENYCGNGRTDPGEECDDGNLRSGDGCSRNCKDEVSHISDIECGNGIEEIGEECDDGNQIRGDGCNRWCLEENDDGTVINAGTCGNGSVDDPREECDDGDLNSDDANGACRTNCKRAHCGDLVIDHRQGEECDDGNRRNNDTCSNLCQTVDAVATTPDTGTTTIPPTHGTAPTITYDNTSNPTSAYIGSLLTTPPPVYVDIPNQVTDPVIYPDTYPNHADINSQLTDNAHHVAPPVTPGTGPGAISLIVIAATGILFGIRRLVIKTSR